MLPASIAVFSVASAVILGLSSVSNSRARPRATPVCEAINCEGCKATPLNEASSNTNNGVQLISQGAGVSIDGTLITKNGSCAPFQTSEGLVCFPDNNCEFQGSYRLIIAESVGRVRDDVIPYCSWSMVADPLGGQQVLQSNTSRWLTSCSGSQGFHSAQFFKNANDCTDGTLTGEVKFTGVCGECPASGVAVVIPDVQHIDIGCRGGDGQITLEEQNQPWLGTQFNATAQGASDSGLALIVMGWDFVSVPLIVIDGLGIPGCSLSVAPHVLLAQLPSNGMVEVSLGLPSDVAYVGSNIYIQVLQYRYENGIAVELSSSNALNLTIGHTF